MKTNAKPILKITLMSLTLLVSLTSFASGDPRSGDDLHGVSIPATLDRALTWGKLQRAIEVCRDQVAGSLMQQILMLNHAPKADGKEMSRGYPIQGSLSSVYSIKIGTPQGRVSYFQFLLGIENLNSKDKFDFQLSFKNFFSDIDTVKDPIVVSDESFSTVEAASTSQANFRGGLAVAVEFQKDSGFDNLKNYRPELLVVTRYSFSQSPIVRLASQSKPEQTTGLKVSAEKFQQCVQSNLN